MLTCAFRRVHFAVSGKLALGRSGVLSRPCLHLQLAPSLSGALYRVSTANAPFAVRMLATKSKGVKTRSKAAAPKRKVAAKKKPKKAKRKPKKAKKKAVKKPKKPKKVLTPDEKERATAKVLRKKALLSTPKMLPENVWSIFLTETMHKGLAPAELSAHVKSRAAEYKSLGAAERERLNHAANENKKANGETLERWTKQYSPTQIKEANGARRALGRLAKARKARSASVLANVKIHRPIRDDRIVTAPRNAWSVFLKGRFASGDFKGIRVPEAASLILKEWKALSPGEKAKYEDERKSLEAASKRVMQAS